jgi:hypothetical protein
VRQADIIKLIGICSSNFRNWPEPDKAEMMLVLWTKMLGDTEYFVAEAAIEKYLSESVYPPTIADIMTRIADITVIKEKTAIEAWEDVKTAIRKFGWYNEKGAMQSLGGTTHKVIESMGFKTLCVSEDEMADRAHFLKVYDTLAKRSREEQLMLPSTRNAMERLHSGDPNGEQNGIRRIK